MSARQVLLLLMSAQIVMITWFCSGTWAIALAPMVVVSALMLLTMSFVERRKPSLLFKVLNYVLVVVAFICVVGYFNPFCEHINCERFSFFKNIDYFCFLPTSIRSEFEDGNALRSLAEIASLISITMSMIVLSDNRKYLYWCIAFFSVNVALMSIYGIYQIQIGNTVMYGLFYSSQKIFGSFFLQNAASTFLLLGFVSSVASLLIFYGRKWYNLLLVLLFAACACSCFLGAFFADSVAGRFLMIATFVAIPFALIFRFLLVRYSATFVLVGSIAFAFLIGLCCSFYFFSKYDISQIESGSFLKDKYQQSSFVGRIQLYKISTNLALKRPFWGSGGLSAGALMSKELAKESANTRKSLATSVQHSHCDVLEFFIEFGVVGVLAILMCLFAWLYDFKERRPSRAASILLFGCLGAIAHSMVDMPLHIYSSAAGFALVVAFSACLKSKRNNVGLKRKTR